MGSSCCCKKRHKHLSTTSRHHSRSSRKLYYSYLHQMSPNTTVEEETIYMFLLKNPLFLDNFIRKQISINKLHVWMKNKLENSNTFDSTFYNSNARNKINLRVEHAHTIVRSLYFPNFPLSDEVTYLSKALENNEVYKPEKIESHLFPYTEIMLSQTNLVFIYMIHDLFGPKAFPQHELINFLARVKINYFDVPFHNYKHAIGHAQSMYWILKHNHVPLFNELEKKTLMISSLSHDLGNPGFGEFLTENTYQWTFDFPFVENRQSQVLFLILLDNDYNIFPSLSGSDLSEVILNLKNCILASHISSYVDVLDKFNHLSNNVQDFNKTVAKRVIMEFLMIVCEISASWKAWPNHKEAMVSLYTELLNQSEKVRLLSTDLPELLIDKGFRNLKDFAEDFLLKFAIPLLGKISTIFPNFRTVFCDAKVNLERWRRTSAIDLI